MKRSGLLLHTITQMNFKNITLSEGSQTQRKRQCIIRLYEISRKVKFTKKRDQQLACVGCRSRIDSKWAWKNPFRWWKCSIIVLWWQLHIYINLIKISNTYNWWILLLCKLYKLLFKLYLNKDIKIFKSMWKASLHEHNYFFHVLKNKQICSLLGI